MRNECNIIRDILPLYIEGMVCEDTASFVEEHICNCTECSKLLNDMRSQNVLDENTSKIIEDEASNIMKFKKEWKRRNRIVVNIKTFALLVSILCLISIVLHCTGIGLYSSGSAMHDLRSELEAIYGLEYTGKIVESGTEDMLFVVEPKTWIFTNWNLRNAIGIDYEYECKVIFTTHTEGNKIDERIITYQAFDPMGWENTDNRAYIDLDTKTVE